MSDITEEEALEWQAFMNDEPPEKLAYEQEQQRKDNAPF